MGQSHWLIDKWNTCNRKIVASEELSFFVSECVPFGVMANCNQIMDKVSLLGRRILYLVLILTQCLFLASYPAIYKNNLTWYLTSLSYAPPVFVWLFWFCPRRPILTWDLFLLVLVVSTAIVFTKVGDSLDKERFPGRNGLKMTFALHLFFCCCC